MNKRGKFVLSTVVILIVLATIFLFLNIKTVKSEAWQDYMTLEYNTKQCLSQCEAIFTITNPTSQDISLGNNDFNVWYEKANGGDLIKPIEVYREETIAYYVEILEYGTCYNPFEKNESTVCSEMGCIDQGTYCDCPFTCQTGSHQEERTRKEYPPFSFSGKTLHAGELWRIKLVGYKQISFEKNDIEWFIDFKGMQPPWAWWNSSIINKRKIWINTTIADTLTNITYYVNSSQGFNLGSGPQYILARTATLNKSNVSMWLYYSSGSEYYVVDESETTQLPQLVTYGNGTNYSLANVFDPSLQVYLPFNDRISSQAFNGPKDRVEAVTNTVITEDGIVGTGRNFAHNDDIIGTYTLASINTEVTACLWIKTQGGNAAVGYGGLVGDTGEWQKWQMAIEEPTAGGIISFGYDWTACDGVAGRVEMSWSLVNDSNWHFICARHETTTDTSSLWLDGVLKQSKSCNKDITSSGSYRVGEYGDAYYYNGTMDEVMIWNRGLSDDEIRAYYDLQKYSYSSLGPQETGDATSPTWSNSKTNASNLTKKGDSVYFNVTLEDNQAGGNYIFSIDQGTGNFVNDSQVSWTLGQEVQVIKTITAIKGQEVRWKWFFTDSAGNANVTDIWSFTVANKPPTHSQPKLQATTIYNSTSDNLTCFNQSTQDLDNDFVTNIYSWQKNSQALEVLNLPFESSARDYSYYNNSGIIYGTIFTSGKQGKALNFDGIDDYVNIKDINEAEGTNKLTIETWVKPRVRAVGTTNPAILAKYYAWNLHVNYNNNGFAFEFNDGGGWSTDTVTYNAALSTDIWYHVVARYDGSTCKIFVNGNEVASANCNGDITTNSNTVKVGQWSNNEWFNGSIDEVRIYPYALSKEQIASHYALEYNKIVTQETTAGEIYQCQVTPNDATEDGTTLSSGPLTIMNKITFDVRSGEDNSPLNNFNIYCNNSWQVTGVNSPYLTSFAPGNYECIFEKRSPQTYFNKTITFTADNDKTIYTIMSIKQYLSIEEHTWLEAIYNCVILGDCSLYNLLLQMNQTIGNIWENTKPTDGNVVTFENITNKVVDSNHNLTIDYTVHIPIKAGYAAGTYLPIRIGFWFLDENNENCYDQGEKPVGVSEPYCQPLIIETMGPMDGSISFKVELQPQLPTGNYNIKRMIDVDPNNNWINYGQETIGTFTATEDINHFGINLKKTGEIYSEEKPISLTGNVIGNVKKWFENSQITILIISIASLIALAIISNTIYKIKKLKSPF